jgi:hypothetical protein
MGKKVRSYLYIHRESVAGGKPLVFIVGKRADRV